MTKKTSKNDKRVLAKLMSFGPRLGEDLLPEFFAEFSIDKSEGKFFILESNVDDEFLLCFLNAIGFVKKDYKKRHEHLLRLDLILSGFNKAIKDEGNRLTGRLCWITNENLCAPYLIEPQNPEDGEPFNIREWRKKKRFNVLEKR